MLWKALPEKRLWDNIRADESASASSGKNR